MLTNPVPDPLSLLETGLRELGVLMDLPVLIQNADDPSSFVDPDTGDRVEVAGPVTSCFIHDDLVRRAVAKELVTTAFKTYQYAVLSGRVYFPRIFAHISTGIPSTPCAYIYLEAKKRPGPAKSVYPGLTPMALRGVL